MESLSSYNGIWRRITPVVQPYPTDFDTVIVSSVDHEHAEALNMDSRPTLEDRIKAIEQLTQIFRTDRLLFLVATAMALLFLLALPDVF